MAYRSYCVDGGGKKGSRHLPWSPGRSGINIDTQQAIILINDQPHFNAKSGQKGENKLNIESQESKKASNNILSVLAGLLIGTLAGAVTMLLLAPKSGKETREQIKEKGIELGDQTTKFVEDTMSQIKSNLDEFTSSGREMMQELKQQGQSLVSEKMDQVSEAAQAVKKAV